MHALNSPRSVARSAALLVSAAALLATGCNNRDELAPDCFAFDANGNCIVPDPGGVDAGINCAEFPVGAVGADYSFTPEVGGGSGNFNNWMATNLPPGLSIDPDTGEISGVPEEPMEYSGIVLSVFDAGKGSTEMNECGPLLINPALSSTPASTLERHCVPFDTPVDEWVGLLTGGDTTDIRCNPIVDSGSDTCPLGDGNGRPPPGITFDADTCTHSGNIAGERAGTYVWIVEIEQSGFVTGVPFCATNDFELYHDVNLTAEGVPEDILQPGLLEHTLDETLSFGGSGTYVWTIDDPACPGPDCNNFGFRFDVTCSPFDAVDPWQITLSPSMGTETGMMHELFATGPQVGSKFQQGRPWVASFEMSYCTSSDSASCDVNGGNFDNNAQTQYHFDVVGYPDLTP
ncbi:hypothetical protein PPSIR1_26066 [Plesiocystis pacifica SIR-1]|uniref:Lipoprotein n=1 Tax=Plesiocystis pacifica SIR-1 TaxID=391625 RepID=A6GFQ8_9BACT|nr:putative Ig domain-containing protein [Plesiocystis pacifica]EDM75309.1 hypothetical protein PPSIR1_26066 [Plesiocystis pacifica SIR-1]